MHSRRNYHQIRKLRASEKGRKMAKARWKKHDENLAANTPPLSDSNRDSDFLEARRGTIARIIDIADPANKTVTTWVMRFSQKGRVDQFDLSCNGKPILTGGYKRCFQAMTPQSYPILRYT